MAMVSFKKGALANLPATKTAGTFYVTTDERAMYLDVDASTRIRLGDFQEFASVTALTANPNPSTTALYYVSDINCLAKWDGTQYVQINKDTGMTSIEVTGDGNAITAAVYDADGRKLTLTKGATYMTSADVDSKIFDKVGDLTYNSTTYDTVKAYVDAKTSGIATDAALSNLTNRVTAAEGDIDALQSDVSDLKTATAEGGTVANAIKSAQDAADEAKALAETKTTMTEVEAKGYATKTEAQGYADAKDTAIAAAKKAGEDAQADVDALEASIGTVAEGKTVVQMISEAQAAATYDDTVLSGRVATIEGDYLKAADKTALQANIDAEKSRAEGVESGLRTDVDAIKADYLKAADKTELANSIADVKSDVDTFLAAADIGGEAIDTLKEIQDYINSDGTAAATMTSKIEALETTVGNADSGLIKSVADNASAISAEEARAKAAEKTNADAISALETSVSGTYETKADATSKLTEAKNYADGLNTAMDARVDALEAIDHDAYALKTDVASSQSAQDTKIDANTAAIETLNGADTVDGSVAKKIKDAITAENLSQYATDTDLSTAKSELEASINTKADASALTSEVARAKAAEEANASAISALETGKADKATTLAGYGITDAYTKTETYTQTEVNALLEWGSF